jgi:RNA polymerase sigma-70 factor (ECF subfamily)
VDLSDPDVFRDAYRDYAAHVRSIALRVVGDRGRAEDVCHDVFVRLWLRPSRFNPARGDLRSFLGLMARSRALDVWRSERVADRTRERFEAISARDDVPAETRPDRAAERAADRETLRRAIGMAYWGELKAAEIAERTDVPVGTAKSRLRLGVERLRTELADAA